jgi:hypothetical protein
MMILMEGQPKVDGCRGADEGMEGMGVPKVEFERT